MYMAVKFYIVTKSILNQKREPLIPLHGLNMLSSINAD